MNDGSRFDAPQDHRPIGPRGENQTAIWRNRCETPRTAGVQAKGDLRTLCFEREPMLRLLREFPDMAIEMARFLALRLERTTAELARLRSASEGST